MVGISTFFPSKEFIFSQVLVVERQAARFYKFASKVLWSRRHLVSWESCHKVVANPSEPSTAASESERKRVLILLIYTAGRALGEQLPTT